ncbi:MAG: serine acetyltransferase [Lachnospiraceae bacterium]|nr:serine acetyltransferase [Lachnospiraceae bacterium]
MEHLKENEISALVSDIICDYERGRDIDRMVTFDELNKPVIIDILNKLQQMIFPAHFHDKSYRVYTLKNKLTMLLEDVLFNLNRQVSVALKRTPEYAQMEDAKRNEAAHRICIAFFEKIPKIREYIEMDVQAAYEGDPAAYNTDEIIFSYPGLYAIFVNRIAHELYLLKVPMIPRVMTEHAHSLTGVDIHPGATLGKYFFIDHGTGIVIGETTVIGDRVKIYQGVTLGALSTRGGQSLKHVKRHPTIEDNVIIYSGASILGGDTVIGHNSIIGGNAFITASIPAGTRVSIKNQELNYNYSDGSSVQRVDLDQDDSWCYVI